MDHYIVKVYRKKSKIFPQQVVGMVEDVATGDVHAFRSLDELGVILGAAPDRLPGQNLLISIPRPTLNQIHSEYDLKGIKPATNYLGETL